MAGLFGWGALLIGRHAWPTSLLASDWAFGLGTGLCLALELLALSGLKRRSSPPAS